MKWWLADLAGVEHEHVQTVQSAQGCFLELADEYGRFVHTACAVDMGCPDDSGFR